MMRAWHVVLMSLGLLTGTGPAWAAGCYNVAKGEPSSLTGMLDYVIFPGPPNFEDVQKGDTPKPSYVLRLAAAICITGDDFADPHNSFRSVQVVETRATFGQLRPFLHKAVTLTFAQQMAAETGHHHEPLVAWVTSISSAAARPMGIIEEYGTAATTIRAFYEALGDGQGAAASAMVVPEKRNLPAFSPAGLAHFYGSLRQPIRLIDISRGGNSAYTVHYRYDSSSQVCDGRAVVTTVIRAGRAFIQGIRTLNGC